MSKRDADFELSTTWPPTAEPKRAKKRRSRWGDDDIMNKTFIPGMPTVIPSGMSKDQEEQYLLQLQIEEVSRRLRTGDLGIPANPEARSPSPEPIYNNEGKRLNTREYRTRKKLEEDRHATVQKLLSLNKEYKPPADYKPPLIRVNDRVMIPQEDHPDINFVGLLIGPRGNTLKQLEKETGAKIIIRGKGSVKEGKIGRKDGQPLPGEDEPLHAYVTANNPEHVKKAVEKIKEIIQQGIDVPEGQNDLRKHQLRELALLNGTLRENDGLAKLKQLQQASTIITNTIICTVCGGTGHIAQDCKEKRPGDTFRLQQPSDQPGVPGLSSPVPLASSLADRAKMDSEYLSLMAELGEGPPPSKTDSMAPAPPRGHINTGPTLALPAPRPPPQFTRPPPLMGVPVPPTSQVQPLCAPWQPGSSVPQAMPPRPPPGLAAVNSAPSPNIAPPISLAPPGSVAPHGTVAPPGTLAPPPASMGPPGVVAPPPPPPGSMPPINVSSTSSISYPWQPPTQQMSGMPMPPAPPTSQMQPPPWQQTSAGQQSATPTTVGASQWGAAPPSAAYSGQKSVVPPPPPPASGGAFAMSAPPPPPPLNGNAYGGVSMPPPPPS